MQKEIKKLKRKIKLPLKQSVQKNATESRFATFCGPANENNRRRTRARIIGDSISCILPRCRDAQPLKNDRRHGRRRWWWHEINVRQALSRLIYLFLSHVCVLSHSLTQATAILSFIFLFLWCRDLTRRDGMI